MKRYVLAGMVLILALALGQVSAFAQAAAESGVLHANSATATAKAGSALGSALNRANKQIGERVQQEVSHPASGQTLPAGSRHVSTNAVKSAVLSPGSIPSEGLLITSIEGGASTCAASPTPSPEPEKTGTQPARTKCTPPDFAGKPAPQKYKSTVTVSF